MNAGEIVRWAGRVAQPFAPRARGGVAVLAYHLVGAGTSSPVDLDAGVFRDQMELLSREERVLSLSEALRHLETGENASATVYVLTFDDAYANFADVVLPILRQLDLPATLYAPCDFVSGKGPAPIRGTDHLPACSWSVLRDLAATGDVEIGSHTVSHRTLTRLEPRAASTEIRASRAMLETEVGQEVRSFCYPRALWNADLERVVASEYSSSAVGGGRRIHRKGQPCTRLPRFPIRADTPVDLGPIRTRDIWTEEYLADAGRRIRS